MLPPLGATEDHALPLSLPPGTMETYHRWDGSIDAPCYLVGALIYPHRGGPAVSAMLVSREGVLLTAQARAVSPKLFRNIELNDLNCSDSTDEEFEKRQTAWTEGMGGWRLFESGLPTESIHVRLLRSLESEIPHRWAEARDCLDTENPRSEWGRSGAPNLTGPDGRAAAYQLSIRSNPLVFEPFRPPTSMVEGLLNRFDDQPSLQKLVLDQLVLGSEERLIDELLVVRPEAAANLIRERSDALLTQVLALYDQPRGGSFHNRIGTLTTFANEQSISYLREIDQRGHKPYRELGARFQSVLLSIVADLERVRDVGNDGSHGVNLGRQAVREQQAAYHSLQERIDEIVRWIAVGLFRIVGR